MCVGSLVAISAPSNSTAKDDKEVVAEQVNKKPETETQKALEKAKTEDFERKVTVRGSLFEALESALKKNKEILSAQNELMAAHENHVVRSSAFRPKVSLNAKCQHDTKKGLSRYDAPGRRGISLNNGVPDTTPGTVKQGYEDDVRSYGIGISQNLFHGFSDIAALQEADLEI